MSALQLFQFPVTGQQVRVKGDLNDPWFHLGDVCEILEISNSRDVAARLDDDQKQKFNPEYCNSNLHLTNEVISVNSPYPWFVNESGLYDVVLRSDKPQAKPFRRWVTSKVLPDIRKTGQYTAKTEDQQHFEPFGMRIALQEAQQKIVERLNATLSVASHEDINALSNALETTRKALQDTTPSNTPKPLSEAALEGLDDDQIYIMRYLAKRGKPATLNDIYRNRHFQNKKMNSVAVRTVLETMTDRVKFEAGKGYSLI